MTTINERILDGTIRHMVWLERYKSGVAREIVELLNKADADLVAQIAKRMAKIEERGFDLGKTTTERLNALLEEIRTKRAEITAMLYSESRDRLQEFAAHEADFQIRLMERGAAAVGAEIALAAPASGYLASIATSEPFQGRLLRQWFKDLAADDARKMSDAIKIGMTEGQTTDQIIRRIRGTRARNYQDGILRTSRAHTESITRTAIAHVANRAKDGVWQANADIIEGLQVVATLDARTTPYCRERDGKVYALGKAPVFPAHFNCRTVLVAYFGPSIIKGTRASAIGPVPEDVTYERWLRMQRVEVQNEALGVKKAQLFRKGGLSLDRFADDTGKEYTLEELKKRDAEIWTQVFGA
jgi:SPP1 gp7 family putative phage head morphogenesis protein